MMSLRDMENRLHMMAICIRDSSKADTNTEKELIYGWIAQYIKEIGVMAKSKVGESTVNLMVEVIRASGKTI